MTSIMNDREYDVMADVERDHWWYRGLRDLIGRVLVKEGFAQRSGLRVLDAGCGTGRTSACSARCSTPPTSAASTGRRWRWTTRGPKSRRRTSIAATFAPRSFTPTSSTSS